MSDIRSLLPRSGVILSCINDYFLPDHMILFIVIFTKLLLDDCVENCRQHDPLESTKNYLYTSGYVHRTTFTSIADQFRFSVSGSNPNLYDTARTDTSDPDLSGGIFVDTLVLGTREE